MKTYSATTQDQTTSLSPLALERGIELVKTEFAQQLAKHLNLYKVTAPMFVKKGTGINDDLNGTERAVSFSAPALGGCTVEVVHSLAKWKRMKLGQLGLQPGEGILTDMRAIRADEELSPLHSLYVDQWDWEKVIAPADRKLETLKTTVRSIYSAIKATAETLRAELAVAVPQLPEEITFIHSEELKAKYPDLTPKQREDKITEALGAVFVIGIGGALEGGEPHDGRAPDYDDWSSPSVEGYKGLNGDILVWNAVLGRAFELSSMGIRVDPLTLKRQLDIAGCPERSTLAFHSALLAGKLPQTLGGGIGQSRMCMFLLGRKHIGEVQASLWSDETLSSCAASGISLL
ncbi:aspartate--ammonia ligase [Cesiribacter sp. SM1]|uniref:aspartate--ammonia ligase n=1 Tax=Cesiribacter sp. SM1 TaxID=2861196 RepID=UPI001CD44AD1|nr:aspartate--ammonia ligase [Cesiribacter sp. SM1]